MDNKIQYRSTTGISLVDADNAKTNPEIVLACASLIKRDLLVMRIVWAATTLSFLSLSIYMLVTARDIVDFGKMIFALIVFVLSMLMYPNVIVETTSDAQAKKSR